MPVSPMNRRQFVKKSAVTGAAVAAAGAVGVGSAQAAEPGKPGKSPKAPKTWSFSVLGTTDLHSHVFNWDYFSNKAYSDSKGNTYGTIIPPASPGCSGAVMSGRRRRREVATGATPACRR